MDSKNIIDLEAENPILAAQNVLSDTSVLYSPDALRDIIKRLLDHIEIDCGNAITKVAEQLARHSEVMDAIAPLIGDDAYVKRDGEVTDIVALDKVFAGVTNIWAENSNLRMGLKFYADRQHMDGFDSTALGFHSAEGMPENWMAPTFDVVRLHPTSAHQEVIDASSNLLIENGGIARGVLEGSIIINNGDGVLVGDSNAALIAPRQVPG